MAFRFGMIAHPLHHSSFLSPKQPQRGIDDSRMGKKRI